jgi:hypothetical protein
MKIDYYSFWIIYNHHLSDSFLMKLILIENGIKINWHQKNYPITKSIQILNKKRFSMKCIVFESKCIVLIIWLDKNLGFDIWILYSKFN